MGGGVDGGTASDRLLGEAPGVLHNWVVWRSKWWFREERRRESTLRTDLVIERRDAPNSKKVGLLRG